MFNHKYTTLKIIGGYALLTLILTYPVAVHLTSQIAGFPGEDNLQWRWFLWWFKYSLLTLQIPVTELPLLFAPTGGAQPLYGITVYTPALALPITLLGGATLSYNLTFLLSFVLSGYTMYLLAYYLISENCRTGILPVMSEQARCLSYHRSGAFVAGLIFAFYPARLGYATGTFLGQLTVYFLPLYILALFMLARRPTWRRVIWAGVILAGLCLTWPLHVAYGALIFTIAFLIQQSLIWLRHPATRHTIKYFAVTFGLTLLFISGFYLPLLSTVLQGKNEHLSNTKSTDFSLDMLAFITPSNQHPILQPLGLLPPYTQRVLADRNDIEERLGYLGFMPLFLAALGLYRFRSRLYLWLGLALTAMTLSLGPLLKFNGSLVQLNIEGYVGYILLPYAMLRQMPILDWSGVLGRLNVITMLSLAIMAAFGFTVLPRITRINTNSLIRVNSCNSWQKLSLVAIVILFEYLTIFPFPTDPAKVPDFYIKLPQEGLTQPQRIIDLSNNNNYVMHYQTVHHQAIAGGHFMRTPAGTKEMNAWLNQLLSPPLTQPYFTWPDTATRLGLLNEFGFTKIVLNNNEDQAKLAYLATWLGPPRQEADRAIFEIPKIENQKIQNLTAFLEGNGWRETPGSLTAPADVLVYKAVQISKTYEVLELSLAAPQPDRYLSLDLNGRPLARLYLTKESLSYHLPLSLSPGAHRLTFRPEEACLKECAPVNITRLAVNEAPTTTPLTFDKKFTLLNYDISTLKTRPGQPLLLYLYWQSGQPAEANYSAFVHLMSAEGKLLGQANYLLGGWLYPTSVWPKGHIVAMPTLFFVPPDAPPGEYQIRAGLYQAEAGQRLLNSTGQDSALLSTVVVSKASQ